MPEILGIISDNPVLIEDFVSSCENPVINFNNIAISIEDGKVGTYFSDKSENQLWIAMGVGIEKESGSFKIMDKNDWQYVSVTNNLPKYGHFVFIKWDGKNLEIANDPFGIRDLFYFKENDKILFSTKIDYLIKYKRNPSINMEGIATDFILGERLNYKSEIKGIERLGPDSMAVFTGNSVEVTRNESLINRENGYEQEINDYFEKIVSVESDKMVSLGLSGGVDSRILLAFLLSQNIEFVTHSFGYNNDNDILMANSLSKSIGFKHNVFTDFDKSTIVEKVEEFLSYNPFNIGFNRAPFYSFYKELGLGHVVIDGAFGEFSRRDYYKKIRFMERIGKLTDSSVFNLLKVGIPPIFTGDIIEEMNRFSRQQVTEIFDYYLNKYKSLIGFDDFLALRFHFPNKMGRDQARIDKYCQSFMPFAQAEPVNLFLFPKRKLLDESVIRKLYKPLSRFPFVKNRRLYPFDKTLRTATKIKERIFEKKKVNNINDSIYNTDEFKNYILDIVHSSKFRKSSILNIEYIEKSINDYYKGNTGGKTVVDYFLSFFMPERINRLL